MQTQLQPQPPIARTCRQLHSQRRSVGDAGHAYEADGHFQPVYLDGRRVMQSIALLIDLSDELAP